MNKIIKYIGASAVVCMMAGCTTNFEDFNTNPYQPSKVPASNLLSTMFNVYACPQQNACQEINCMWASFSGQVTATASGALERISLLIIMRPKGTMTVHGEDSTAISILLSFWSRTLRKRKVSFMPWLS